MEIGVIMGKEGMIGENRNSLMAVSGDGHVLRGGVDELEGHLVHLFSQGSRCDVVRHLARSFGQGGEHEVVGHLAYLFGQDGGHELQTGGGAIDGLVGSLACSSGQGRGHEVVAGGCGEVDKWGGGWHIHLARVGGTV